MAQRAPQPQQRGPVRSLRIGIILGGKIVEEKLVRPKASGKLETITIGQSAKNTFAVPVDGLPRSLPLFQPYNDQYILNFTENMDGRLSDGRDIYTFEQLRAGPARRNGPVFSLPLNPTARGKVTLGELTVLFQFVKAPPVQPRPMLPASVRGSLADRVDPVLAAIMGVSIIFHGAFAYWLYQRDVKARTKLEMIADADRMEPERQAELFTIPTPPVEVPVTDTGTTTVDDGGDKPAGDDKDKKPKGGGDGKDKGGGGGPPSEAGVEEAVEDTAVIRVLTGGAGGAGSRYSEMGDKDPGGDLDKSLRNAGKGGGKVSTYGEGGLGKGTRGPGTGEIGTGTGPGVGGPGEVGRGDAGDKGDTGPSSNTSYGDVDDFDETDLDPDVVASTIRKRYLKGIKRCHEQVLKRDPKAGGRIEIEFTVGKGGKVIKSKVGGEPPEVLDCVRGLVSQWRFAIPKDEDGKPTEATFAMPFLLKPGG